MFAATVALTVAIGTLLGAGLGWAIDRRGGADPAAPAGKQGQQTAGVPQPGKGAPAATRLQDDAPLLNRAALKSALVSGAKKAKQLGGRMEAALDSPGWEAPVFYGNPRREMRMWSMAKPITAVALYLADPAPSEVVTSAIAGALERSENCRQRRVVLELQQLSGGPKLARKWLTRVLALAHVNAIPSSDVQGPDPPCPEYLQGRGRGDLQEPTAPALLLGTSMWTIGDAVRFAFALDMGKYGPAGERVLDLMRRPKQASREAERGTLTMSLDFGAGRALRNFHPAYKAGWGGQQTEAYVVGQYGVVKVRGTSLAFAVMFHPSENPADADPGKTVAPQAIETVLRAVARKLQTR